MSEDSLEAYWLGTVDGIRLREHLEEDDMVVVEIHGEEDTAAMEVDNELAKRFEEASRAMQHEVQAEE